MSREKKKEQRAKEDRKMSGEQMPGGNEQITDRFALLIAL
jgi:hypothetical protein